jgi:hypothetical protein
MFGAFWGSKITPRLSRTVHRCGADCPALGALTVWYPSADWPSSRSPYRSYCHFSGYHLIFWDFLCSVSVDSVV